MSHSERVEYGINKAIPLVAGATGAQALETMQQLTYADMASIMVATFTGYQFGYAIMKNHILPWRAKRRARKAAERK